MSLALFQTENFNKVTMQQSFGYILNRRPFRDSSLLLDIFTADFGRICCVARPAKKRGKIVKGDTEPFRYLKLQWTGKGDVQTLVEADEQGRHKIPPSEMTLGLYINELLLLLTKQHVLQPELFSAYKYTLHKLHDADINRQILMRFEIYLLASFGYAVDELDLESIELRQHNTEIYFNLENGFHLPVEENHNHYPQQTIKLSTSLFFALQDIQNMQESHWKELRVFLDAVFSVMVSRPINSRKFLSF